MVKAKAVEPVKGQADETAPKECFVIMPIADMDGYPTGHFQRVYDWIIKPACEAAGFKAARADDVASSSFIVADILKSIVNAEMVICDLSGLNPNAMFELGLRQAYGKPVALIKDNETRRIFDISGIRDVEYDVSLRADLVQQNVKQITKMIQETSGDESTFSSLMALVDIDAASLPQRTEVSDDSKLILQGLHRLSERMALLETSSKPVGMDNINSRIALDRMHIKGLIKKAMIKNTAYTILDEDAPKEDISVDDLWG